jgi:CBS domain-containing protein
MGKKQTDDRQATAATAPMPESSAAKERKDYFLQLMFFQAHRDVGAPSHSPPEPMTGDYVPLPHSKAKRGEGYSLPLPSTAAPVQLEFPATNVMTDLRRVSAVTIDPDKSIAQANQVMIAHRVRALFVIDAARRLLGLITSTDILGERPILFAQGRGIRYDEVVVGDIMTPADSLEVLDFNDVLRARVGDIVATLKLAGRQHALVVETSADKPAQRFARGIFSLTQIARQLGIPAQQVHDIARTFAEIEAAIAS